MAGCGLPPAVCRLVTPVAPAKPSFAPAPLRVSVVRVHTPPSSDLPRGSGARASRARPAPRGRDRL